MSKPRALDLFCCAGGVSVGLARAGFDVTGVDSNPRCEPYWRKGMEPFGGEFICADALTVDLSGFDLICASPPCQRFTSLRHLQKGREYPDLIGPTRERLQASGALWCIENVEGAPLGASGWLIVLCGTMFGLQTPDGRAEIRRHRLFETSWSIALRPACQHGHTPESVSVTGTGMGVGGKARWRERSVITVSGDKPNSANTPRRALSVTGHSYHTTKTHPDSRPEWRKVISVTGGKGMPGMSRQRRTMSVTGATPQTQVVHNQSRETFSIDDARAAMGISWMPMRFLSQAIPPAYSFWIGEQAMAILRERRA